MSVLLLFLLSLIPLALGNEGAKAYGDTLLLIHAVVGGLVCYRRKDILFFVTPNALVFFYTSLSMTLGAWGFDNGYVIVLPDVESQQGWQHAHVALSVIMTGLAILLAIDSRFHARYLAAISGARELRAPRSTLMASAVLLPFFVLPLDLAVLGGQGDLAILPKTVFATIFIVYVSKLPRPSRLSLNIALIIFFATFSIQDKREAIFLIFPIVYIELLKTRHTLNLRFVATSLAIVSILLTLILAMSVARGYGEFGEFNSLLEALPLVLAYLNSDIFIAGFLSNIEANYFYFHAMNSIELIIRDPSLISHGSTIIKPFFIFVPRYLVDWKPESIISLYTTAHDPSFRMLGGSWPISLISEMFWNFKYCAPFGVAALALVLARLHLWMLRSYVRARFFLLSFLLYGYMHVITMARGSGIDQYVVYLMIGAAFFMVTHLISRGLHKKPNRDATTPCAEY